MATAIGKHAKILTFALLANALLGLADASAYMLRDSTLSRIGNQERLTQEPFGLPTSMLGASPLQMKWREVENAIATEASIVADCDSDHSRCASRPALRFLEIVHAAASREGVARLGEINRAFNLAIRPMSDQAQYGVEDHWSSPLATLEAGAGDCEDYAIAKLVALRAAGVSADDLRLVIIREATTGEDHAVVTARADGRWRVLDNRTLVMIDDGDLTKYQPLFAIDAEGAKRFEQPMIAQTSRDTQVSPAEMGTQTTIRVDNHVTARVATSDEGIPAFAM